MSHGVEKFILLACCLACCWPGLDASSKLRVIKKWNTLKFVFPSKAAEEYAIEQRHYVEGNSLPIDVDAHYGSDAKPRIFVTIPRFDEGRPVTFGTVDNQGRISGYPDYSWHENQGSNCQGLTSVFRVAIDDCNRLWVMDTGKIGDIQHCRPQLLAFDLRTDKLIYRHVVNNSSYISTSLFVTPVVDVRSQSYGDCSDTFVYVADVSGFGLLVVDVAGDRSWRVTNEYFHPKESNTTFTIDGESFSLHDGILGLALSAYQPGQERLLYFHALASTTENVISTEVLRDVSLIQTPIINSEDIYVYPKKRKTQSAAQAIDRNGILYFGYMNPPSILCWNTENDFSPSNFHNVAVNSKTLQFASGVKVVNNCDGIQELWVMTSSFQRYMTGTLKSDETNYRIHSEKIPVLIEAHLAADQ